VADRVERLTNLLALLLETPRPLSLVEITAELDGLYPAGTTARRGAFERDKAALREIGVPIESEIVAGGPYAGQTVYRVDRSRYELAQLDLDPEERRALQVAVAATRGDSGSAQDALWKLGAGFADDNVPVIAVVPSAAVSERLAEAVLSRAVVRFTYRDRDREVEPYGLLLREGFWYLIGFDRDRAERRTYRVDRIASEVEVGEAHAFEPPPIDLRAAVPSDPKLLPDPAGLAPPGQPAVVRVDAPRAAMVQHGVGAQRVLVTAEDGSITVEVPYTNTDALVSWVLGLGQHAEVLAPAEARAAVVTRLEALTARGAR